MNGLAATLRRAEEIVGASHLLTATDEVGKQAVEGQTPVAAAFPGSAEEVAALLRAASEAKLSVLLRGAGQHLYLGAPPEPIGLVVSLARLDSIVEYDPEDLTLTAQAGMSLGVLQRAVGKSGQMLPLDPPGPESATLGGVASANLAGPMRVRYGSARDLVIGLRVALASGEVIKTGGRTVKNVAGYSLTKLFIGSLGTVGAIVEVTTRLTPLPEAGAMLAAVLSPSEAREVTAWLVGSPLEVAACELVNGAAALRLGPALPLTAGAAEEVLLVGLAGDREALARQQREIRNRVRECACLEGEQADELWRRARELAYPAPGEILARAMVPISRLSEMMDLISSWEGWSGIGRAGDGLVYARPPTGEATADSKTKVDALRAAAQQAGGFAVLESGPLGLKREFPVWGEVANWDLMRELKQAYDPAGILGCGRLLPRR
jgi:glycolate oxidase FAD binding subunit